MLPAKKFGVLVPDYAVGFGPALWKKKIGDTTYALRAILLGGYVKIVGMYAPARPGTRLVGRRGKVTLAQEGQGGIGRGDPAGPGASRVLPAERTEEDHGHALRSAHEPADLLCTQCCDHGGHWRARCVSHDCFGVRNDPDLCGGDRLSGLRGRGSSRGHGPRVERNADRDLAQFQRAVGATPEGESAVLTVGRDGTTVDLTVTPVTARGVLGMWA